MAYTLIPPSLQVLKRHANSLLRDKSAKLIVAQEKEKGRVVSVCTEWPDQKS